DPKPSDEEITQSINLKFTTYSNLSLVNNKRSNFKEAIEAADKALRLDLSKIGEAEQSKAYFRRGCAHVGLKDDDEAVKDFEKANSLKKDPATTQQLEAARGRLKQRAEKFKNAFKKAFK